MSPAIPANAPPGPPPPPLPENPVVGTSSSGKGVTGQSNTGVGIWGQSTGLGGGIQVFQPPSDGVFGQGKNGVHGLSVMGSGSGVLGENSSGGPGVSGSSVHGAGVSGSGQNGDGVLGQSQRNGVHGKSASATDSGVWGENTANGYGVSGSTNSSYQPGKDGTAGVWGGNSGTGVGVKGTSAGGDGVIGYSSATGHAGVSAVNDSGSYGLWAQGTPAGHFEGDVEVNGNVRVLKGDVEVNGNVHVLLGGDVILANQDCAEDFEMLGPKDIGPGSVVVIDSEGALKRSDRAYDKRVAGVISGAGDCKPGIILGRQRVQDTKMPLALLGKVYCKVDAGYSSIEVGDLLTTSATPGHAMKAADHVRAFGAVIGKALLPLEAGQGLIPILVALQ